MNNGQIEKEVNTMPVSLTKPSIGSTGWGTAVNQNFTDIEEAINDSYGVVATSKYTATPASDSRITMSDTSDMAVGLPLRYSWGSTDFYGIVTAISTNSYIDIAGAPLVASPRPTPIEELCVGTPSLVDQVDFFISGTYGDGVADLLSSDMNTAFGWRGPTAYIVRFHARHQTDDTGTEPKINVTAGGSAYPVSTYDSNYGVQPSTTWVANSAVAINTSNYQVDSGEALEIRCTAAGGTGDAEDLTVSLTIVRA